MTEIFELKRNTALLPLEGLRLLVKRNIPFTYEFKLVDISNRGMPRYTMHIHSMGEDSILVASKVSKTGATIRKLNLHPAVVSLHTEFGKGKKLEVYLTKTEPEKK